MKLKAYKFRLLPNKQQQELINKTIGCCRLIYNCMLYEKQENYKNNIKDKVKTEKEYKVEKEFLREVDSVALQQSRIDLLIAYKNFFRKIKKKEKVSLRYKSKKNPKNSYRTVIINNNIRIKDNYIKLPKLDFVKFIKSREVLGKIKSVTISKTINNKYYLSILCETKIDKLPKIDKEIALDLGIKDFCISNDNVKIANPKYLIKSEIKLKKTQRKLSKRVKNSNRKYKMRKKLSNAYEKVRNQRLDFLHKLSTKLIRENQTICLENLTVKNMIKNHKLAKAISDASWSMFMQLLEYKADWYGRDIVKVDRFFPSSKLCNNCKYKYKELTLKERSWTCPDCGITHDRDLNAAKNILEEGKRIKAQNLRDEGVSSVNIKTLVLSS